MSLRLKTLKEACGVFGVFGHPDAAHIAYHALHSLQHRGQEGSGIVVSDGNTLRIRKDSGLVTEVFTPQCMQTLKGNNAIGHVRYSLASSDSFEDVQPLLFRSQTGGLAVAHNGNIINARRLRADLEEEGSIFQTELDAEILAHLIKRSRFTALNEQIKWSLTQMVGGYAFVLLTETKLFAALDPYGLRPLSLGSLGDALVVASESCAFDLIGAKFEREIAPGELLIIDEQGFKSENFGAAGKKALCAMEYIYFSRPDSDLGGKNVHTARKALGKALALEHEIEADVVTGVPDSSLSAAIGYAETSGLPYELGLIKSRYVGRTFIEPSQSLREQGVKLKLSAVRGVVEGKRVVMVDDSFVRGTTGRRITTLLKEAGAAEVHVLIASPPIRYPCFYGMDTLSTEQLLAAQHDLEEMRLMIGADSLGFLSLESLLRVLGDQRAGENRGLCSACFSGNYPTKGAD